MDVDVLCARPSFKIAIKQMDGWEDHIHQFKMVYHTHSISSRLFFIRPQFVEAKIFYFLIESV